MRLTFIGLGRLGGPVSSIMAGAGHRVSGYDIVARTPDGVHVYPTMDRAVAGAEFIFIAVPTPHDPEYGGDQPTSWLEPRDFNYDAVSDVLVELQQIVRPEQTIVLISTVLPGTIRERLAPLLKGCAPLIYNPYLIAMGSIEDDMHHPEMLIIGTDLEAGIGCRTAGLLQVYEKICPNARMIMGSWEEAECVKVFYNTFISMKLSFVNMVQDVAERLGNVNADRVCGALAESGKRITSGMYMKPGMGDGGACHPRDNIALRFMARKLDLGYDLFGAIMEAREGQAINMANRLIELSNQYILPIRFTSFTYKPDVLYEDGSYSRLVASCIPDEYIIQDSMAPAIIVLTHPQVDGLFPLGSLVFDPWREFCPGAGVDVYRYGAHG